MTILLFEAEPQERRALVGLPATEHPIAIFGEFIATRNP